MVLLGLRLSVFFYYLRGTASVKNIPIAVILLAAMGGVEVYAVLALIPILLYNGQKGAGRRKAMQYGFYIFYPAHLLLNCSFIPSFHPVRVKKISAEKSPM